MHGDTPLRVQRSESSPELREQARRFRHALNTAEDHLWQMLRDRRLRGLKFRRQHPIGRFIADFYCAEHRLIVEIDGGIHNTPDVRDHDVARDEWLTQRGERIVRLPASLVMRDIDAALKIIGDAVEAAEHGPHPQPLSRRNGRGEPVLGAHNDPGSAQTPEPLTDADIDSPSPAPAGEGVGG